MSKGVVRLVHGLQCGSGKDCGRVKGCGVVRARATMKDTRRWGRISVDRKDDMEARGGEQRGGAEGARTAQQPPRSLTHSLTD